ncbi:Fe-S oxidoreductase [Halogeometricum pallidum JCM 14848]|uniref:Fe-S oxidoreductase n=1 Tax=Halogeometricum pallidum JCM 14848 TaxID=1227487 RepID=M0DEG8_HALPD|nr:Fe-S oxidoreductase [Halogeometricum pallidum JCM 14848]
MNPRAVDTDRRPFVSRVGDVCPSGFLPGTAGPVGDRSVVDRYPADLFRSLRDRDALRGKCGACESRNRRGGSRSRAFAYTGDPLASDPFSEYVPEGYDGPRPEQSLAARDASSAD